MRLAAHDRSIAQFQRKGNDAEHMVCIAPFVRDSCFKLVRKILQLKTNGITNERKRSKNQCRVPIIMTALPAFDDALDRARDPLARDFLSSHKAHSAAYTELTKQLTRNATENAVVSSMGRTWPSTTTPPPC